ncbi:MAG: ATP-binding protein [Coriobacteriaceae bacterium]|jgi:serine/threonine-protein kinase RsbW|nr:MAG: ATP-binding protein [Coriobacteriaceae bacterium]
MQEESVVICVPPKADFARSVRMLAANLGVVCALSVDDIEDLRMAAEEGFVYTCATNPETVTVHFTLSDGEVAIDYSLGSTKVGVPDQDEDDNSLAYADLLLSAICDEHHIDETNNTLHLVKHVGATNA